MPNKHNEKRRHHVPKIKFKVTNWAEYDAGLRRRGSLTLWVTDEAIAGQLRIPANVTAAHEMGLRAWFKNGAFKVTRASELLPPKQWNFSVTGVGPGGMQPPAAQARCG